jgi:hypothetical protein
MPEIIPETRGRRPLPPELRKRMVSFRISIEAKESLERYLRIKREKGEGVTKAKAIEDAIINLERSVTHE